MNDNYDLCEIANYIVYIYKNVSVDIFDDIFKIITKFCSYNFGYMFEEMYDIKAFDDDVFMKIMSFIENNYGKDFKIDLSWYIKFLTKDQITFIIND